MRILALIPARRGSKRLPGKNSRVLGTRPLVAWSIAAAKGVSGVCDILVSTDDATIAAIARDAGALVPWIRPPELATDEASSVDVCLHALDWYEREHGRVDGLLLLQPTSPFRSREAVTRGLALFASNPHRSVLGVSAAKSHPMWCFTLEQGRLRPFVESADFRLRSQDLPPAYALNGAFYLVTPDDLRTQRSFHADDAQALLMNRPEEGIDIDTELDWKLAESFLLSQDPSSSTNP